MCVPMRMWFASRIIWRVRMLVNLVVNVSVRVLLPVMGMFMFVLFRHMQPHAHRHKRACYSELERNALMQGRDGGYSAKKWRCGEISGRARASQMP